MGLFFNPNFSHLLIPFCPAFLFCLDPWNRVFRPALGLGTITKSLNK